MMTVPGLLGAQRAGDDDSPSTGAAEPLLKPFDDLILKFLREKKIPGIGLAISKDSQLVYARGFGLADRDKKTPVQPDSLFRLSSLSKTFTSVAVMKLVEQEKVKLDDPILKTVKITPLLAKGEKFDPRWEKVTVRQCLQHTIGFNQEKQGDPTANPVLVQKLAGGNFPVGVINVARYALGKTLDTEPGAEQHYSNIGYLLLGRLIENLAKQRYEDFVRKEILLPLKITNPRLGKALPENRQMNEVRYYDSKDRESGCLYQPRFGKPVPIPDGAENFEAYEAHAGWIASPVDVVRFLCAFDDREKCPILKASTIAEMWAPPPGLVGHDKAGKPLPAFYSHGWTVRPVGDKGLATCWHIGRLSGTSNMLVRRHDNICWAILMNTDTTADMKEPAAIINDQLHATANAITEWPKRDLFAKFLK
jgi:N-acyl-D-amino-acid deacylase